MAKGTTAKTGDRKSARLVRGQLRDLANRPSTRTQPDHPHMDRNRATTDEATTPTGTVPPS